MRRHVRALGHEAQVAQRAGVDDRFEVGAADAVDLTGFGVVDQIEQPRETVAQIEASPAAVADVEHPPQFGVESFLVVEGFVAPRNRVADRRFQAAFAHRMAPATDCR